MRTWTIGRRMSLGFAVLTLLTVAVGGFAVLRVNAILKESQQITQDAIPGLKLIALINGDVRESRALVIRHVLSENPAKIAELEREIKKVGDDLNANMEKYKASIFVDEDRRLFGVLEQKRDRFRQVRDEVVLPLSRAQKTREAEAALDRDLEPAFNEYITALDASVAFNSRHADELGASIGTETSTTKTMVIIAVVISLVVGVLMGWLIIGGTNKVLGTAIEALGNGSRQVVAAAGQVASSAQTLSQGSTEQAASVEETSASMEEMASMARQNSQHADSAASLMAEVDDRVKSSNRALETMVTSMEDIRESSVKVSKIIKTIDEIAFQTNILALNAAVEAARAGDAGMGFAVVADEVRNLAQRSAQAARDTASLIEMSVSKAQAGAGQVEQVVSSIKEITERATRVKDMVDEISAGSKQQAQGIDQVAQAISQIEKVTQSAAATAEESAAASEELNAQAEATMRIVEQLGALVGAASITASAPAGTRATADNSGENHSWMHRQAA